MEIQINGHPIEFSLENEKTLPDMVESISRWARERDLIFTDVWVDDVKHSTESLPATPIERISVANCVILSRAELVINSINEATDYCSRVIEFAAGQGGGNPSKSDIEEMKIGIDWLAEVTLKVLSLLNMDAATLKYRDRSAPVLFNELKDFRIALGKTPPAETGALIGKNLGVFGALRDLLRIVLLSENMRVTVLSSTDSPDTVIAMLHETIGAIPVQVKGLEESAAAYQAGRDGEGSAKIESFIDFVYRYFRVCHQVGPVFGIDISKIAVNGSSLAEKNSAINDHLNQILNALENNDIIGMTDVLEYEMKPALEGLAPYCEQVFAKIQDSK